MLVATLAMSAGAIAIATPLGIGSAVFSCYYCPRMLVKPYRRLVELMAGIPSVVYGLWGLGAISPLVAKFGGSGQNLTTATIVLSLMVLPTVALATHAAIRSVAPEIGIAAAALGMDRWSTVRSVVLPAAKNSIAVAVFLSFARAIGETMAVLMVAGNVVQLPQSFVTPVRTLNANMALEMGYASADHRSVLFVSGLILLLVSSCIVLSLVAISSQRGGNE